MRLIMEDSERLTHFLLPEKPLEKFLFSYYPAKSNIECFLNIVARNQTWCFENNQMLQMKTGANGQNEIPLQLGGSYPILIKHSNDQHILYCKDLMDRNGKRYQITSNITVGKSENNHICYQHPLMAPTHLSIINQNGNWYITTSGDPNIRVYLNSRRVYSEKLKIGDVIFVNGLKIIWMEKFIQINQDVNVKVNLQPVNIPVVDNHAIAPVTEEESLLDYYESKDYFFHRPRLRTVVLDEVVTIDEPPTNEVRDQIPILLQFASSFTMLVFAGVTIWNAYIMYQDSHDLSRVLPQIIMALAMILGSIVAPILLRKYNRKLMLKKEALRQEKYSKYLDKKEKEIKFILENQKRTLLENHPSNAECSKIALGHKHALWSRELSDDDFLTVRLGLGDERPKLEIKAPQERFTLYEDNLLNRVYDIVGQSNILREVPITISLTENFKSAIVTESTSIQKFIDGILLQLVTLHSGKDLKIIFLTDEENEHKWSHLKVLPHLTSDDKSIRFFATNISEVKKIISYLEKEYERRKNIVKGKEQLQENVDKNEQVIDEEEFRSFAPYYLIVTDQIRKLRSIEFINQLLDYPKNLGFSLLMLENSLQNLPASCNRFIYVLEKSSCLFSKELETQYQKPFERETNVDLDMSKITESLATIPLETNDGVESLPTMISFLEMLNVGNIEQLNIINKWKMSDPINTLKVPVGVHAGKELFMLDLHEKAHGPHGLIAGSTGSGKSEFIITYLLSLAIHFHPYEVQFVLIDYKGGGLAGAFENRELGIRIPHLAGTITNLDTSEMNRTLVSIESELKRRQRIFNEVRDRLGESTIDIYKYQKLYREGMVEDPIPHLFIVSDEFAELKSQQPEFMEELISISRIGRSLGVHLILATQKPSGVVNDQIWSNSKFKVCLKVQTRNDSMEMLKREEAASIKETGRFYLQVGYNELFEQGQSAWCGAKYYPSEHVKKLVDDDICFIDNTGGVIKTVNDVVKKETEKDCGEQLTNIVKYLIEIAEKEHIETKKLWLEMLPEKIFLPNLTKKYQFEVEPQKLVSIIGEYDDPMNQAQGIATFDFVNDGNALIYGVTGSGKENLITTLLGCAVYYHTPEEIQFYLLDFGSETLRKFKTLPHVGDVIFQDEQEKMVNFVSMMYQELERRKKLFADFGGSYGSYLKESKETLPFINVVLNGYEVFLENFGSLEEAFATLFRDGIKYGISFIVTTTATNTVRYRLLQFFSTKICLRLNDESEYRYILDAPKELIPSPMFGRGLYTKNDHVYEFQTAYISEPDAINQTVLELGKQLSEKYPNRAKKVPTLPDYVLADDLKKELIDFKHVPVGIKKSDYSTCMFNFIEHPIAPVISNSLENDFGFILGLIEELHEVPNTKIRVIDTLNLYEKRYEDVSLYTDNLDVVIQQIELELDKDSEAERHTFYFFLGISGLKKKVGEEYKATIARLFAKVNKCKNNHFVIADNYLSYRSIESEHWYREIDNTLGFWLGKGIGMQMTLKYMERINEKNEIFRHVGYYIHKGQATLIKYVVDKEDADEK